MNETMENKAMVNEIPAEENNATIVEDKKFDRKKIGKIIGGVAAGAVAAFAVVKIVTGIGKKNSGCDDEYVASDADFEPVDSCESNE